MEEKITLNGKSYPMVFTWGALVKLQEELGDNYIEQLQNKVFTDNPDVKTFATVVAIVTEAPLSEVLKSKEPIVNAAIPLSKALQVALIGPFGGSDEKEQDGPKGSAAAIQ